MVSKLGGAKLDAIAGSMASIPPVVYAYMKFAAIDSWLKLKFQKIE